MSAGPASALAALDAALTEASASVGAGVGQAGSIDVIAGLEGTQRAISAVQAEATAAFATLDRDEAAERGVPATTQGASVARQITMARRVSEEVGARHGDSTAHPSAPPTDPAGPEAPGVTRRPGPRRSGPPPGTRLAPCLPTPRHRRPGPRGVTTPLEPSDLRRTESPP